MITNSIKQRLLGVFLGIGILSTILLSVIFYYQFRDALVSRTFDQLESINRLKSFHVESVLKNMIEKKVDSTELKLFSIHEKNPVLADSILKIIQLKKENTQLIDLSAENTCQKDEICLGYIQFLNDSTYLFSHQSVAKIKLIMYERTGMGSTGETYIVGQDFFMRTPSRFSEQHPLEIKVNTKAVREALNGKIGTEIIKDYRNEDVLSSFRLLEKYGIKWVIISEIDLKEAKAPVEQMKVKMILIGLVIILLIATASIYLSNLFSVPIQKLKKTILELAIGKIPKSVSLVNQADEISSMINATNELIIGLNKTIQFASKIGKGDFEYQHTLLSQEDMLGNALVVMQTRLRELQEKNEELNIKNQKALITGQETERIRLSKELHDSIGPLLTVIKIQISEIEPKNEHVNRAMELTTETIREVRRISSNLMPSVLLDFGVGPAIKNYIELLNHTVKIPIQYLNDLYNKDSKLTQEINIAIFRIVQEALNNAVKYANPTQINVSLTEFDTHVSLFIKDNGKGFNFDEWKKNNENSNGLRNIESRVKLLKGFIDIQSDEKGTILEIEIPLE